MELFGPYAHGNPRKCSDIDVAVVVDKSSGDCLESEARLNRLRRSIDLRIEPVLFEEDEKDPEGFFEEVLKDPFEKGSRHPLKLLINKSFRKSRNPFSKGFLVVEDNT